MLAWYILLSDEERLRLPPLVDDYYKVRPYCRPCMDYLCRGHFAPAGTDPSYKYNTSPALEDAVKALEEDR